MNAIDPSTVRLPTTEPPAHGLRREFRLTIIGFTLAFWFFNWCILTLSNWLDGWPDWTQRAQARALADVAALGLCWVVHRLLGLRPHWPLWKRAGLIFVLSFAAGDLLAWFAAVGLEYTGVPGGATRPGAVLYTVAIWSWLMLAWGSLYLAVSNHYVNREQEARWTALQSLAQKAQLQALHYQIRPHFLFNALNAIVSLILESRNPEAVDMTRRLSDFLRKSLELDPVEEIRLADELALQSLYLHVEAVRFPDLQVSVEADPSTDDVLVPTLILQPVVENAVKYAVGLNSAAARIAIRALRVGDDIEISVVDNGPELAGKAGGAGVGLRNVRQRLRQRYGDHHRFEAGPLGGAGYRVWMRLPASAP